jgi:hypothetical protein
MLDLESGPQFTFTCNEEFGSESSAPSVGYGTYKQPMNGSRLRQIQSCSGVELRPWGGFQMTHHILTLPYLIEVLRKVFEPHLRRVQV